MTAPKLALPRILALLDMGVAAHEPALLLSCWAEAGLTWVQYRDKAAPDREFGRRAAAVAEHCARLGLKLTINDRVAVARLLGVGVHVGQEDLAVDDVRALLGAEAIVGLSTDSLDDVAVADGQACSYVAHGPVYATGTKPDAGGAVGLEGLREARARTDKPLVAVGGIDEHTATDVWSAGADTIAVAGALAAAADPAAAAARLMARAREMDSRQERM